MTLLAGSATISVNSTVGGAPNYLFGASYGNISSSGTGLAAIIAASLATALATMTPSTWTPASPGGGTISAVGRSGRYVGGVWTVLGPDGNPIALTPGDGPLPDGNINSRFSYRAIFEAVANAVATGVVSHIVSNAVVNNGSLAAHVTNQVLGRIPASTAQDTPIEAPAAPVDIPLTGAGTIT